MGPTPPSLSRSSQLLQVLVPNPTDCPKQLESGAVIGQVEPLVEGSPRDLLDGTVEAVSETKCHSGSVLNVDRILIEERR